MRHTESTTTNRPWKSRRFLSLRKSWTNSGISQPSRKTSEDQLRPNSASGSSLWRCLSELWCQRKFQLWFRKSGGFRNFKLSPEQTSLSVRNYLSTWAFGRKMKQVYRCKNKDELLHRQQLLFLIYFFSLSFYIWSPAETSDQHLFLYPVGKLNHSQLFEPHHPWRMTSQTSDNWGVCWSEGRRITFFHSHRPAAPSWIFITHLIIPEQNTLKSWRQTRLRWNPRWDFLPIYMTNDFKLFSIWQTHCVHGGRGRGQGRGGNLCRKPAEWGGPHLNADVPWRPPLMSPGTSINHVCKVGSCSTTGFVLRIIHR